jgi:hypothetical protein
VRANPFSFLPLRTILVLHALRCSARQHTCLCFHDFFCALAAPPAHLRQDAFRACFSLTRTHDYLRATTRRLVEVHIRFQLQQETLYMTFHLLDRFLSIQQISRSKLQLAGITAMLVASK